MIYSAAATAVKAGRKTEKERKEYDVGIFSIKKERKEKVKRRWMERGERKEGGRRGGNGASFSAKKEEKEKSALVSHGHQRAK